MRRDPVKDMARVEKIMRSGPHEWWDGSMIVNAWHGKVGKSIVLNAINALIELGRIETNGGQNRGRKFRLPDTARDTAPDDTAPEPFTPEDVPPMPEPEQPLVLAVYSDRIEMPLSSGVRILEALNK